MNILKRSKNDGALSTDLHPAVGVGGRGGGDLLGGRGLDGDLALWNRRRDDVLRTIILLKFNPTK